MENKDENDALSLVASGSNELPPVNDDVHAPPPGLAALSLDSPETGFAAPLVIESLPKSRVSRFLGFTRRLDVLLIGLLVVVAGIVAISALRHNGGSGGVDNLSSGVANRFNTVKIPLGALVEGKDLTVGGAASLSVNGLMQLNDAFLLAPSPQPTGAKAGQIYYDENNNQLAYFNGQQFIFLTNAPASGSTTASGVQGLGGATGQIGLGDGLVLGGGVLSNAGVLSVQGQTGAVTLTPGPGITVDGTTIGNGGVLSVAAGTPNVTVDNDGQGNITLSVSNGGGVPGTGTVTSSGGTTGAIPLFTGAQNIEDSIISQSGLTVTISGDLSVVTGGLTLSNSLTVSNGGTGATSLASNGVLVGQGTAAITTVTAAGAGLCLLSTAGAPTWAACPSSSGVSSLNGLSGGLSIANASGAGNTITIDNASTTTKGIASFTGTNFSAAGGVVNTIQNINTAATPTFAGVNTNNITSSAALTVGTASQTITLQGDAATSLRATSGAHTTTVAFTNPIANTILNFPALAAGTYTICTTSGNCAGAAATLQGAYDNSTSPEIVLDATRGALTVRDNATPLGVNLLEVQNNAGSTTYLAVTVAGVNVTGTTTSSGNINTTGGTLQTNSTSRIDNAGNLINIGSITASGNATLQGGGLTLGTNAQAGSLILNDGSSNTGTIQVAALGQNTVYTLPDPGGATAAICLTTGNCAGTGGGVTTGGGTTNQLVKFTGAQALGDSSISDDGTNVTVSTDIIVQGGDLTVGTASQAASLLLHDGSGQTTTLQAGNSVGNLTFILPTNTGSANQCLKQSGTGNQLVWQDCDGGAGGSSATLQTAYNNSTSPPIVLNGSVGGLLIRDNATPIGGSLLAVQNNAGSTTYLHVTAIGVSVTGTATATGNINSSGGALQTGGTSRLDNAGNLINIGNATLTGDIAVNGGDITSSGALNITPGGALVVGASGQVLTLQGNASTTLTATGGGFMTTVGFTGTPSASVTYNFDRTATGGPYTICTSVGNCAGTGGGVTTSGGTGGKLAKFTGAQTLGDSLVSESGAVVTVDGNLNLVTGNQFTINGTQISSADLSNDANLAKLGASQTFTGNTVAFKNGTNSTNAFNIQNALGSRVLTVDTSGAQVLLGTGSSLDGKLVFSNLSNNNTVTIVPGTPTGNRTLTLPNASGIICTDSGNCAGAGATLQTAYNFSAGGTTPKIKVDSTLLGVDIQDADTPTGANLLNVRASNSSGLGSVLFGVGNTGAVTLQNSVNSTTALRLLTSGGTTVLTGDTTNGRIILGQSSTLNGAIVFNNATNTNTTTLVPAAAGANRTVTLPDASGTVCLSSGNCSGSGSANTLQAAYDAGNTITSSDGRDISIALADTTTDGNLLIDLQCDTSCSTNGRFAIQDDGTDVFTISPAGGAALLKNSVNSTTALRVQQAGAGSTVVTVDTANGELELGQGSALSGRLVFNNATNTNTITLVTPAAASSRTITLPDETGTICLQSSTNCGFAPATGSGAYIRNGTTVQAANFFVQNAGGTTVDTAVIQQSSGQTGKLLRVEDSAGTTDLLAVSAGSFAVNTTMAGDIGTANMITANVSPVNALVNGNWLRTIVSPGATASGLVVGTSASLETGNNASYTANLVASLGQLNWNSTGTSTIGRLTGTMGKVASAASTGNITTAVGVQAEGQFQGGGVTDYYGLYSTMNANTSIAIQNAYGLKIDDFAATGGTAPTNFYAIATDGGQVRLRANSATALQVQSAAGAETLFTVDTTARSASGGNIIKIGNSIGTDTATTILKLDATTADPTSNLAALNGGLFYNSTTNKVSIVENGAVKVVCNKTDLGCGSATTSLQEAYDNSSSPASVTTVAGKDVLFNMTDTAPAPNFLVDLQCDTSCPGSGRFAIQDDGVDTFKVNPAGGSALFKNSVNSATAFQIQNFATIPMFQVDTSNNAVYIGNPAGDVTGVPLVLDTKTDASDPIGITGGMYYNSFLHEYRCYRGINGTAADGIWEPCGTNPMDRGYNLEEEFMGGDTASNTIGQLGWGLAGNGTNTLQYNDAVNGDGDHPGIFHITTGAVSGNGDVIFLGGNGAGNTATKINGTQVIKAGVRTGNTVANAIIRVGMYTTTTASTSPNSGVWWEADAATNANWRYCYGNGTAPVCTATASPAVAVATASWSSLEIRVTAVGTNASSVDYFINNGGTMTKYSVSGVTVDSTSGLAPALSCWTSTTSSKNCFFDYFQFRGTSSARR